VLPFAVWTNPANHNLFYKHLEKQLGIANHDQWYEVPKEVVYKHGGMKLLQEYYNDSLHEVHFKQDSGLTF
jgi:hypothetical protein